MNLCIQIHDLNLERFPLKETQYPLAVTPQAGPPALNNL